MQDIKKECDKCKGKETIRKTIDNPKPNSLIQNVKVSGRGKEIISLNMDLCLNCQIEILALCNKWVTGTASLQDF